MSRKTKSITQVTNFALVRLSSVLYTLHKEQTMKQIADKINVNPSVLSSIKNGTIKSIALPRVLRIIDSLEVEYTMSISSRNGVQYYSFEMDGYGSFGRSDKEKVETKTPRSRVVNTDVPVGRTFLQYTASQQQA